VFPLRPFCFDCGFVKKRCQMRNSISKGKIRSSSPTKKEEISVDVQIARAEDS
jgi:hypothetical protein